MKKLLAVSLVFLTGCGVVTPLTRQESKLSRVDVGMPRNEVLSTMGSPDDMKESKVSDGHNVRVDEYRLFKPGTSLFNAVAGPFFLTATWWTPWLGTKFWSPYWVQYTDGKVSRIVRDTDWNPDLAANITVHQK